MNRIYLKIKIDVIGIQVMKKKYLHIILLLQLLTSCINYSPYEIDVDAEDRNMNDKNIQLLTTNGLKGDTAVFAFIGDTQRFYDETNLIVQKINQDPKIEFVIISGDLSDFGLNLEFEEMLEVLKRLNVPFLSVIGNHDFLYNGEFIYQEMFGDFNYTFLYKGFKFIMINTNSRESQFNGLVPDIEWLNNELSKTNEYKNALVVGHVPPYDRDFDTSLETAFSETLVKWKKTLLSLNGHYHDFSELQPYPGGITYLNSFSTGKGHYLVVRIWTDGFSYEIKDI